jgi:molecular chaperone IbpA
MVHNPFSIFDNLPSLTRNAIGFDDMFKRLAEFSENFPKAQTYPPFNIVKTDENTYVIEMAVAGFGRQDIEIVLEDGTLTVTGNLTNDGEVSDYIYKGVADRAFTRSFTLADTVEVKNADLINGMLKIWLERFIPEHAKPKKIDIKSPSDVRSISSKKKEREAA